MDNITSEELLLARVKELDEINAKNKSTIQWQKEAIAARDKTITELRDALSVTLNAFEQLIKDVHDVHPEACPDVLLKHIKEHRAIADELGGK